MRQLRELVRYRHKRSQLRTGLKGQVHVVLGKEGVIPQLVELWGSAGHAFLNETRMGDAHEYRLESLRDLIEVYDQEITALEHRIHDRLQGAHGYRVIQQLNGVGRVHAAVFVAEIGDVGRFGHAKQLCSWAGLTACAENSNRQSPVDAREQRGTRFERFRNSSRRSRPACRPTQQSPTLRPLGETVNSAQAWHTMLRILEGRLRCDHGGR